MVFHMVFRCMEPLMDAMYLAEDPVAHLEGQVLQCERASSASSRISTQPENPCRKFPRYPEWKSVEKLYFKDFQSCKL